MSKKNFKIDELEERIAPSCLSLGSVLNDVTGAVGSVSAGDHGCATAAASTSSGAGGATAAAANHASAHTLDVNVSLGVSASAAGNLDLCNLL